MHSKNFSTKQKQKENAIGNLKRAIEADADANANANAMHRNATEREEASE